MATLLRRFILISLSLLALYYLFLPIPFTLPVTLSPYIPPSLHLKSILSPSLLKHQQLQQQQQQAHQDVLSTATTTAASRKPITRRLIAVADLHGDLAHAQNVLRMSGLIDSSSRWIGGKDVLISTGDIVDRGDDTIELYRMFDRLREEAKEQGGEVWNVLGNHEVMNAMGDWRYVTKGDLASFGGAQNRRHAMSTQGWIGQTWLDHFNVTRILPLLDPSSIPSSLLSSGYKVPTASFTHGGILPSWASRGISEINRLGASLLFKSLSSESPTGWLPEGTTSEERALWGEGAPLWCRNYSTREEEEVCRDARETMGLLGVRHLVMGHTPHFEGFVVRCQADLIVIDTGISRAYGGEQSALIFDVSLIPQKPPSKKWEEKETLIALYKGRKPKIIDERRRIVG